MNRPLLGGAGSLERLAPLAEAGFLTDVDLLTGANESDEHAPFGDALAELDEGFRLRLVLANARMLIDHLLEIPGTLRFVVHDHVLRRDRALVAQILLHVVLDAAHEGLAATASTAQLVLQDLHKGPVAAEEDGRRRWLAAGAFDSQIVEAGIVDGAQSHKRLPGPRNACDENEMPRVRAGGLVCDGGDRIDGRLGLGQGAVNRPDLAVQEELTCSLNQRGERAVGISGQELVGGERAVFPRALELLDELVQRVRASDVHAITNTRVAVRARGHEDGVHFAVRAVLVVAAQVTGVRRGLVEVGLLGLGLAFEFEDDDGAVHEQDHIGPSRFER